MAPHECKKENEIRDVWNEINDVKKSSTEPVSEIRERLKAIEVSQGYVEQYLKDIRESISDVPNLRARVMIGSGIVSVIFSALTAILLKYALSFK